MNKGKNKKLLKLLVNNPGANVYALALKACNNDVDIYLRNYDPFIDLLYEMPHSIRLILLRLSI